MQTDVVLHDCSTLGGNSGSVVLDLATGQAVGLHFAGRFLEANYAVPAAVVAARLERVLRAEAGPAVPRPIRRRPASGARPAPHAGGTATRSELIVEGVPADYVGRNGYDPAFLGPDVPLPVVRQHEATS